MANPSKLKSCGPKSCPAIKNKPNMNYRNGKGDKPRAFSKSEYNKNYESINWSKK
jgi:hypothetical protein